jgi:hypothetical protein
MLRYQHPKRVTSASHEHAVNTEIASFINTHRPAIAEIDLKETASYALADLFTCSPDHTCSRIHTGSVQYEDENSDSKAEGIYSKSNATKIPVTP